MYHDKIRKLEITLNEQDVKINKLKAENSYSNTDLMVLLDERSKTLRELSSLRRLQYEEEYQRVKFDDDR